MKKEQEKKYQVEWKDKDARGYYDTFILAKDKEEAETLVKTAIKNGGIRVRYFEL